MATETKQMSPGSSNIIELDKLKINQAIEKEGKFYDEGITIEKWVKPQIEGEEEEQNQEPEDNYLSQIERNTTKYIGTLNGRFQRDGYGLQLLENGDKYFGEFGQDQRNKTGLYFWNPKLDEDHLHTECYIGEWADNKKENKGTYIWMDELKEESSYDTSVFDAFVGELNNEKYTRGTYLSKSESDFYLYHGNFDTDCKKTDDNAFFYTSQLNRVFHGEVNKDLLVKGYIAYFEDNSDEVKELIYSEFNEDGTIALVKRQKEMSEDEIEEEIKNIRNFRSIALDGNFFKKIYSRFTKCKDIVDGKIVSIEDMEDNEGLIGIINKLQKYNVKCIYNSVEENFFGREF